MEPFVVGIITVCVVAIMVFVQLIFYRLEELLEFIKQDKREDRLKRVKEYLERRKTDV